jgi:hypothetical protein
MKTHKVKILPVYYNRIIAFQKTFEIRKNDRDYQIGDELILREFDQFSQEYTGRECHTRIIYVEFFPKGLQKNYVVLGIKVKQLKNETPSIPE